MYFSAPEWWEGPLYFCIFCVFGWGVVEVLIWLFSFIHISFGKVG